MSMSKHNRGVNEYTPVSRAVREMLRPRSTVAVLALAPPGQPPRSPIVQLAAEKPGVACGVTRKQKPLIEQQRGGPVQRQQQVVASEVPLLADDRLTQRVSEPGQTQWTRPDAT
jgi:hypothetical protein